MADGAAESSTDDEPRIAVLSAALADQIAAGEVVERPASIVKELVDNAVDAGARRVEVELTGGGRDGIRVVDDGRGIHAEDLPLALTRHATSKLDDPAQLIEIRTLGFRGEALASIAAVARVDLRSRRRGEGVGHRARSVPGEALSVEPIGMPEGTQVSIEALFANVPARRKFLRSEATEVGHCVDAVIRIALVHPGVQFKLRHNGRKLLELAAGDLGARVSSLLTRRGGTGPYLHVAGERRGVEVEAWLAPPEGASRQRNASFVVVRRRVVRERTLAKMLRELYAERLPAQRHPVACLFVEPPPGTVDVNVHPQKSEVRFSSAQDVFAAVREVLDEGSAGAPWRTAEGAAIPDDGAWPEPGPGAGASVARDEGSSSEGARAALAEWSRRGGLGASPEPPRARGGSGAGSSRGGYRLGTRASSGSYGEYKATLRTDVDRLRMRYDLDRGRKLGAPERGSEAGARPSSKPLPGPALPMPLAFDAPPEEAPQASLPAQRAPEREEAPVTAWPQLLAVLPGASAASPRPVALFEFEGAVLAVDLCALRAELVRRRLIAELAEVPAGERVPAQGLLEPVVVEVEGKERALLLDGRERLAEVGVDLDDFGSEAVVVRAVPAVMRSLLSPASVAKFLTRLTPWLRLRMRETQADTGAAHGVAEGFVEAATASAVEAGFGDAELGALAGRHARRWLAEALREHGGSVDALCSVPGVRRWTASELVGERR
ncbi:DNA mismatch repair protein [Plesiocystis pacifica SIR-1]|uniref:DNA mismatch repair protein MutL n=1 Tax=Plesiocystis pacifica SIR-1 TaxID=391625 RepID=A6G7C7_9BACT|nr:DNA mismatch repair endonuclease MutL [Plesiocystis pacifica]EDM78261.1 DNA mismatch repair protein [Plesiocystis pacifica SIR-1]